MVFRKGGTLPRNLEFTFENTLLKNESKFTYLGVVFATGSSFTETQNMLAGQARKALFILEKYIYNFTTLTTSHMIDVQSALVISTSVISNNRLSRRENLIPVLTEI